MSGREERLGAESRELPQAVLDLRLPAWGGGGGTWALAALPAWPRGPTGVPATGVRGVHSTPPSPRQSPMGHRPGHGRLGPLTGAEMQMEQVHRHSKVPFLQSTLSHPLLGRLPVRREAGCESDWRSPWEG